MGYIFATYIYPCEIKFENRKGHMSRPRGHTMHVVLTP